MAAPTTCGELKDVGVLGTKARVHKMCLLTIKTCTIFTAEPRAIILRVDRAAGAKNSA
jgi:hypothetical protein